MMQPHRWELLVSEIVYFISPTNMEVEHDPPVAHKVSRTAMSSRSWDGGFLILGSCCVFFTCFLKQEEYQHIYESRTNLWIYCICILTIRTCMYMFEYIYIYGTPPKKNLHFLIFYWYLQCFLAFLGTFLLSIFFDDFWGDVYKRL